MNHRQNSALAQGPVAAFTTWRIVAPDWRPSGTLPVEGPTLARPPEGRQR